MSDYAVKVGVRNGRILSRMKQAGIKNLSEMARRTGVRHQRLIDLVNFALKPVTRSGDWAEGVIQIAKVLDCEPEELFTPAQMKMRLASNRREVFINETEMLELMSGPTALEDSVWVKIEADRLLGFLTSDRDRYVVGERMNGRTHQDIADENGWTHGYVGQVEQRAYSIIKRRAARQDRDVGRHLHFSS